jgi:hypothetical protein
VLVSLCHGTGGVHDRERRALACQEQRTAESALPCEYTTNAKRPPWELSPCGLFLSLAGARGF